MRSRGALGAVLKLGVLLVLLVGTAILARTTPLGPWVEDMARRITDAADRPWAPFAFVGLYAAALALGIPGTLLTLLGAAAFGFWRGMLLNLAGATLGSTLAFLEGRFLARAFVQKRFAALIARLGDLSRPRHAFAVIARLRLFPLLPLNAVNFASGVTQAPTGAYALGTLVGIIPSTAVFTYFATALLDGGASRAHASAQIAVALALLALLSVLPFAVQALKRRRADAR